MTLRRRALWGLLLAKAVAGIGVGWDIRWHIVIGRDSFWIAPHVMTYAGVALAAILSLGVLLHETWSPSAAMRNAGGTGPGGLRAGGPTPSGPVPPAFRIAGLVGTRGYHLAWWG